MLSAQDKAMFTSCIQDLGIKLMLKEKPVLSVWFGGGAVVGWIMVPNDIQALVPIACEY